MSETFNSPTSIIDAIHDNIWSKPLGPHGYRDACPRIECADGTTLSVQAGRSHYCMPRDGYGPWVRFEVGYPSAELPEIMEWAEDAERPTDTVYGYVPKDKIAEAIIARGGLKVVRKAKP